MTNQTSQLNKSDIFMCGAFRIFTDVIYLVCTADRIKLWVYIKTVQEKL